MIALNTAGGIAGTLLTGFFLVPLLGLVHTLGVLAMCAAALGVVAVVLGSVRSCENAMDGFCNRSCSCCGQRAHPS